MHGMHLLLRMLEHAGRRRSRSAVTVDATFRHPAFLGETIEIDANAEGLVARAGADLTLVQVAIAPADAAESALEDSPAARNRATKIPPRPVVRTAGDIDGAHGVLVLPPPRPLARAFPAVARTLGPDAPAALAAISALVGMECPGRDSLLSAVRLRLTPGATVRELAWRVARVDRRFGLVRLAVSGAGIGGTVDAFLRPRPAPPPTMADAAARVDAREFTGQRALIVGGSRGLGAATALLIAAGGGAPVVTYASGAADAKALRRDIRSGGRAVDTLRLDVNAADAPARVARAVVRHRITHVYYFASPRIFVRRRAPFDETVFDRFAAVYVRAFARLCAAACRAGRRIDVFYPSTVAVANAPAELTEYAAAKAAGETVCAALEPACDGLHVLVSRLPRVATDQTASIVPASAAAPIDVMLPIARDMQRRSEHAR